MYGHRIKLAALLLLGGASVALACGPFFPWQLLDDRTSTLRSTPNNTFAYEAAHLAAPPTDHLKSVEPTPWLSDAEHAEALSKAETQGLSADQGSRIQQMREASDGDAAYAAGNGLPVAIRLYTAGAVDFRKTNLAPAAQRFQAVLALPEPERAPRATWAAYMAGRTAVLSGDFATAAKMFAITRRFAIEGRPDPQGLAVDGYGEEAKFHYDRANAMLVKAATAPPPQPDATTTNAPIPDNPDFEGYDLPAGSANAYRSEIAEAVALYAEQASRGSDSGVQSLRIVAQNILTGHDRIDAVVSAPLVQRLLVVYALARVYDNAAHDEGTRDAGTRESGVTVNPVLPQLVNAILKAGNTGAAGADRLAALCYRVGRYDLASQLADKSASPIAEWVKAKIALQKGDLAAAAQHYAAASKGFPQEPQLDDGNSNLVVGESGVLELARGDYVDALDKLYPVAKTYWGDVAYIAERVLTVDELKDFVDAKVTAAPAKASDAGSFGSPSDPAAQLRDLLGRRLMREGRYAVALPYFSDPKVRSEAAAYVLALHEANTDWGRVDRAQAYFQAAVLARESGIDILGYEAAPDFANFAGEYDTGIGQDDPKGAYVTPDERARAMASRANPNLRFHYRYIAFDEASMAADLLPPRSQAFAATLCSADGWMMQTPGEQARVKAIYARYLKQGAHVVWAKTFGRSCPDPDFVRAISLERHQLYRTGRHYVSVHRWWFAGAGSLALFGAAAAALFAIRRRSRPS